MRPDGERQPFTEAVKNACAGVAFGLARERNIQIDCGFALAALVLGFAFSITQTQWFAVIVCIGMVLGLELVNTAIESVVDLVSPDYHMLAGRAKDCAAGACLVASICAFIVGVAIFAPPILHLLFGIAL